MDYGKRPDGSAKGSAPIPDSIMKKAVDHAMQRIKNGESPYAE
jgi:hypothetical protein